MADNGNKPSYLLSVFTNRCPRCRQGKLFETPNAYKFKGGQYMNMNKKCPVCGQPSELEVGFYYGTGYVSYAVTVAFSLATFLAWWVFIGISINDNRVFWWLGINSFLMIVLQPVFMRFSRSLWISWFVKFDPNWDTHEAEKPERIVDSEMNNW